MPAAVAVVIPARDEEELLPACLDAVAAAIDALREVHPVISTRVVVVLDACRDGSAEVVAGRPDVTVETTQAGSVGIARALGVESAALWAAAAGTTALWIACTDADSVVPRHWLLTQIDLARDGRDLVVGTVQPRAEDLSHDELAAWRERHTMVDGHPHVHGANLGFSLHAYESVGGFAPLASHEDVELVEAMRTLGISWVASGAIAVTTSGRRSARAPHGFAGYLDGLGA